MEVQKGCQLIQKKLFLHLSGNNVTQEKRRHKVRHSGALCQLHSLLTLLHCVKKKILLRNDNVSDFERRC